VFGQNLPLALSSKLHAAQPDNLLRVILDGVREPAGPALGFMPPFRDASTMRRLRSWRRICGLVRVGSAGVGRAGCDGCARARGDCDCEVATDGLRKESRIRSRSR